MAREVIADWQLVERVRTLLRSWCRLRFVEVPESGSSTDVIDDQVNSET